jgi:predicted metal-dependent phosphoesterase TrpH
MSANLHVHSTASDGKFSPSELIAKAASLGLTVISITDHDTIDGIAEALETARAFPGLKFIPGVEISCDLADGEAHMLGYFIDFTSQELKTALDRFRSSREGRARRMIAKLGGMGIRLDWQRVQEIAGDGSIGRPHIAEAMVEKGYINAVKDAFNGYIERSGPAYAEREKITPAEAVGLILNAGGIPVLAHPFTVKDPEALVKELKPAGLAGIETYYKDYTADEVASLATMARKHGLITTGGNDFHGLPDSDETLVSGVAVPAEAADMLIAVANERGLKTAYL